MSLNMLRHNVEMLIEISDNYYRFISRKEKGENVDSQINGLKNQMIYLQTAIKKLVEQEKNG